MKHRNGFTLHARHVRASRRSRTPSSIRRTRSCMAPAGPWKAAERCDGTRRPGCIARAPGRPPGVRTATAARRTAAPTGGFPGERAIPQADASEVPALPERAHAVLQVPGTLADGRHQVEASDRVRRAVAGQEGPSSRAIRSMNARCSRATSWAKAGSSGNGLAFVFHFRASRASPSVVAGLRRPATR